MHEEYVRVKGYKMGIHGTREVGISGYVKERKGAHKLLKSSLKDTCCNHLKHAAFSTPE